MKNKYIKISDLYFEILEMSDFYNIKAKYEMLIIGIFESLITCTLQKMSWANCEYISLNKALIIKEQFNKILKELFRGGDLK